MVLFWNLCKQTKIDFILLVFIFKNRHLNPFLKVSQFPRYSKKVCYHMLKDIIVTYIKPTWLVQWHTCMFFKAFSNNRSSSTEQPL